MLDRHQDIESSPQLDQHDSADNKPILEPQLNVGGHGATQRRLKDYHVTMIGLCSGIGTGLFIGTGAAYANAGPAGLLLAYLVVGSVLWCVMQSIAELATVVGTPWPGLQIPAHHRLDPYCWFVSAFRESLY
jgi:amino acid transporter